MTTGLVETIKAWKGRIDTPDKWHKGNNYNFDRTAFCIIGAEPCLWIDDPQQRNINAAAVQLAYSVVEEFHESKIFSGFNDDPATSHADVMRFFDALIIRARGLSS